MMDRMKSTLLLLTRFDFNDYSWFTIIRDNNIWNISTNRS